MVFAAVDVPLGIATPEPFAEFTVDEVSLDVIPAAQCPFQCGGCVEMLVDVEETHHGFGLHPPVAVGIDIARVEICFVGHGPVGIDALHRSFCHPLHDGLHLCQHFGIAQHQCRLVQQP